MLKNISATRYKTFDLCPRKYKFNYHYKLFQKKGDAMTIGSLYHEMLEKLHTEGEASARDVLKKTDKHKDILEHLFAKYLAQPVLGNVIDTEREFTIVVPNLPVPIYGFIDRLDEDKGVEYKTSAKKWGDKELLDNDIQTKIYLYAMLQIFGHPKPLVYSINNKKTKMPPQEITIVRTESEILSLEDDLRQFVINLDASTFPPTPGQHCYFCPWGRSGDNTCEI